MINKVKKKLTTKKFKNTRPESIYVSTPNIQLGCDTRVTLLKAN